jgi:hypothetical protein
MGNFGWLRFLFFAGLALFAGFLALAFAVTMESHFPVPLIALMAPGLKLAELVMPKTHRSFAWTFGWFLRIAILVNAAYYFALLKMGTYLLYRKRPA